jgi:hypothetical protein
VNRIDDEDREMKNPLLLGIGLLFVVVGFAEFTAGSQNNSIMSTYELYSWQQADGNWNFCVLFTTSSQKTAQEVFSRKCTIHGTRNLKERISLLEPGSTIVWFDRLTFGGIRVKGSETLKYPPRKIIDDVTKFAQERQITILGPNKPTP